MLFFFFFLSFFLPFFLSLFFLEIKHTRLPPHRHKRTSTSLLPHRLKTNTQVDNHTGSKTTSLPPHRRKQNYKIASRQATKLQACLNTGKKLQAHSHTGERLQACRHTGVTQKLQACCHTGTEQNYKLTATRAYHKTTSVLPHRHRTKLQAYCHKAKNYKLVTTKV